MQTILEVRVVFLAQIASSSSVQLRLMASMGTVTVPVVFVGVSYPESAKTENTCS